MQNHEAVVPRDSFSFPGCAPAMTFTEAKAPRDQVFAMLASPCEKRAPKYLHFLRGGGNDSHLPATATSWSRSAGNIDQVIACSTMTEKCFNPVSFGPHQNLNEELVERMVTQVGVEKLATLTSELQQAAEQSRTGCLGMPVQIHPVMTLAQVHFTLQRLANLPDGLQFCQTLHHHVSTLGEQSCALYLLPVWDWCSRPPLAAEFWKSTYQVARDNHGDDWIAPHMSVHSRSLSIRGLAEKFRSMLLEVDAECWYKVLQALNDPSSWTFEEDFASSSKRPAGQHHYALHKASMAMPKELRQWLFRNQDTHALRPRKQDVRLMQLRSGGGPNEECVPVVAPFHVSTYGFCATRSSSIMLSSKKRCLTPTLSNTSSSSLCSTTSQLSGSGTGRTPSWSSDDSCPDAPPQGDEFDSPPEQDVRADLASADWMWVFGVPGRTGEKPLVPSVFAAVRLESLARAN
mmetsp:Transcript_50505/g.117908  ORF Transcript_50505/g.117908 Transcript_50505/m.117908 type:complete len:460 (+) Transcript_50505:88-1467(+)|eukprot:4019921-Amphidinium_carterae.1